MEKILEKKIFDLVCAGVIVSESLIMSDDDSIDGFMLEASQQYEERDNRFAEPVSSNHLTELKDSGIPTKTRQSTNWALNVWKSWVKARKKSKPVEDDEDTSILIENIEEMEADAIGFWLPRFVVEMRKENGSEYPPDSVYSVCSGLQRHLRVKDRGDVNFFVHASFNNFRQVLDAQMKKLKSSGNFEKKCADVISEELEDRLWDMKILGSHTPQALLNTVFYYMGLFFALRGGEEHRSLRHSPPQVKLYEPTDGPSYLTYTETVSKTNQGGLLHRNRMPKVLTRYQNTDCPERCLIRLFKLYNSKCTICCLCFIILL